MKLDINTHKYFLENIDLSEKSKTNNAMEIKRDLYLNKLIGHKHNGFIKIVSGIRRSGKSYLLFEIFKNHLLWDMALRIDLQEVLCLP